MPTASTPERICPHCGRTVKARGFVSHVRLAHGDLETTSRSPSESAAPAVRSTFNELAERLDTIEELVEGLASAVFGLDNEGDGFEGSMQFSMIAVESMLIGICDELGVDIPDEFAEACPGIVARARNESVEEVRAGVRARRPRA